MTAAGTRSSIAILGGTGALGSGLAMRLSRAGHHVTLGSRDSQKAEAKAAELNASGARGLVGSDNVTAASRNDVIFLTVPYASQASTAEEVRACLGGKLLVDTTVPLVPGKAARVQLPAGGSAAAALQEMLGAATRVVSAFQNVSAVHLGNVDHPIDCDVLVCGDDAEARETVIRLASDMGVRAFHAGSIRNSAAVEALTSVLIAINIRYKISGAGIRITGLDAGRHADASRG